MATVLLQAVLPALFDPHATGIAFSLDPLARTFSSPRVAQSIVNSLELAATVACTTTALGGAFAVLVERCDIPLRPLIAAVPWLVFLTPSYLKALAWVLLMSPGGYLAQLGVLPPDSGEAFFGLGGLVFVHTLSLFPLASFIIGAPWRASAANSKMPRGWPVPRPFKVWLRINGPLLAPAIALSCHRDLRRSAVRFRPRIDHRPPVELRRSHLRHLCRRQRLSCRFPLAGAQALVLLSLVLLVVLADRLLRRRADAAPDFRPLQASARSMICGGWRWPATLGGSAGRACWRLSCRSPPSPCAPLSRTLGRACRWSNFTFANIAASPDPRHAANDATAAQRWSMRR